MTEQAVQPKIKRSLLRKIINVFIGIFLGIIFLIILFLGFTQTRTFREFLRTKIIEEVNSSTDGKLNIEKIDGTILTSIFLRNTLLTVDGDTMVFAKNVEVKTSPLQLLLKKIYFRKILFEDVNIKLLQNKNGEWNYSKLFKQEEDTTKSSFSFLVQINDLQLKNINFTQQTFSNLKSEKTYPTINFDDLKVSDLYLSAQAFFDVANSNYLLLLKELTFKPNLNRFTLRNLTGEFAITKEFTSVKNFAFITDSSDIRLNAQLENLDLFGNTKLEDFKNYPVDIDLDATSFNFDDLSSFIGGTEILKGNPSVELKASGKFGGFRIDKLVVDYRSTHFEIDGEVLNLNTPESMFIKAKITDTDINYKDVNALLPSLELPKFAKLLVSDVNIEYEGEPTNFKTIFAGNVENGVLNFECTMNLNTNPIIYDIKFETGELDLTPIIGITTSLNSKGSLIGAGVSPNDLTADFQFTASGSTFNQIPVDGLKVSSKASDRKIDLEIDAQSKKSEAFLIGDITFDADTIPSFSLLGSLKQLDLSSFFNDDYYRSNLNFYFSTEGKNFNLDNLTGTFSFGIDSSKYRNTYIKYSNIDISIKKDSTHREINLVSDFMDFNITGDFSLNNAINLLAYESATITGVISDKLNELNPLAVIIKEVKPDTITTKPPPIVNKDLAIDYDFKFKDFKLIAALLGSDKLDIGGTGSGRITNQNPSFSISTVINLDYIIFMGKDLTIYLSDLYADINFTRDNRYISFDKLFGTTSITGKRFYSGNNIKNIAADIIFNQSKLFFNASAEIENLLSAETEGIVLMTPKEQQILVDKIALVYKGLDWINRDTIKVLFNPDYFKIANCIIQHDTSTISINGKIESNGKQNLSLIAANISGEILDKYFLGVDDKNFKADADISARVNGEFNNPIIKTNLQIQNLSYNKHKLGNLLGTINYANKKVSTDIKFLDSTYNYNKPLLTFEGSLPVNLSFGAVQNRLINTDEINLTLRSENFNLRSLGILLPTVSDQQGNLEIDINISGIFKEPHYSGYLSLTDGYFKSNANNLKYSCGLKLKFDNQEILIDSMVVANAGGSKYKGQIKGYGGVLFDGFSPKDLSVRFNGDLAVLGEASHLVSPFFYGDLLIGTESDWLLTLRNEKLFFKGNILLKQTNLMYILGDESAASLDNNFNFIFVIDSSKIDKELLRFQEILSSEKSTVKNKPLDNKQTINFDYEIGVKVENSAQLVFVLSQAVNQKLLVDMRGDLKYESYGGETRAQGAFELISGSKLEFFKTFDAEGLLRFESDITNPYLDIIATYSNDYINPRDANPEPQYIAVKIKIKGPLNELGRNLASNPESIGVYVGAKNIQNNIRETRYDYADAFSFILIGKFKDDLTAQDRTQVAGQTNAIGSTATSFLGTVLTSFVNSAVGDLVNNIQISKTGDYTKFSLSGRIQNLRYSLGGTTEIFQYINRANVKLEYLFNPKFLIRLERKDPIVQNYGLDEKINEMALKYRFEF